MSLSSPFSSPNTQTSESSWYESMHVTYDAFMIVNMFFQTNAAYSAISWGRTMWRVRVPEVSDEMRRG